MTNRPGLIAILLMTTVAAGADEPGRVHGRILDEAGRPVAGASVAGVWGANGLDWDRVVAIRDKEPDRLWRDEGKMEPWGAYRVLTDAEGRFSIPAEKRRDSLMAYDRERRRGAVVRFDPKHLDVAVEARLQPLVRVVGTTRRDGDGVESPPKWSMASISLPTDERNPLAFRSLATCGSFEARFAFHLPPGTYEVSANADEPMAATRESRSFTVDAGQAEVDLGALTLHRRLTIAERVDDAKARGTWGNYRQMLGKEPPAWHVTDAKGVPRDCKPADFKGRWVLLYFWSPNCAPCLGKDLPELIAFYEAHKDRRDRFEILAFCDDFTQAIPTVAALERKLEPVKASAWGGKGLPFPVLLDNTLQTFERFGREGSNISTYLLIDPEGKIAEGDLATLARKIEGRDQD